MCTTIIDTFIKNLDTLEIKKRIQKNKPIIARSETSIKASVISTINIPRTNVKEKHIGSVVCRDPSVQTDTHKQRSYYFIKNTNQLIYANCH